MPRSISRITLSYGLLVLVVVAAGCRRGPTWDLAPVEGTVTRAGRPLADIEVDFLADVEAGTQGPRARGMTDDAGHYRLRTDNGDDGGAVGKHRVCLVDPDASPTAKRRVPLRYEDFDKTPLRADVHPGPQTLDFDVP